MISNQEADLMCKAHQNKQKNLYCQKENIWFCEFCLKNHKDCGYPQHFSEVIENGINLLKLNSKKDFSEDNVQSIVKMKTLTTQVTNDVNKSLDNLMNNLNMLMEMLASFSAFEGAKQEPTLAMAMKINNSLYGFGNQAEELNKMLEGIQGMWNNFHTKMKDLVPKGVSAHSGLGISKILSSKDVGTLMNWLPSNSKNFKLLFRASEHDFLSSKFHSNCVGIAQTLVIARTNFNKIIGGQSVIPWKATENQYEQGTDNSNSCFLFSVTQNQKYGLKTPQQAICNSKIHGPKFGGGHDIEIVDKCNNTYNSYYNIGHTYGPFNGPKSDFYGNEKFFIEEYEVFSITQ